MRLSQWFQTRGSRFVLQRARALLGRYGLSERRARQRIERGTRVLRELGCAPTFFIPGRVVQRNPTFVHCLQDIGAEIAVHSYDHIDLAACSLAQASDQLVRAAQTLSSLGIQVRGFRCPYLSYADALASHLPRETFKYSSNRAVLWDVDSAPKDDHANNFIETLGRLYAPSKASDLACVPWTHGHMIEIPVSLPDDLQLYDGLGHSPHQVAKVWAGILDQTHKRGELFTLLFHTEIPARTEDLFGGVLERARHLQPSVWAAQLREVADWWLEKAMFRTEVSATAESLCLSFHCSERATVLARNLSSHGPQRPWDGTYHLVETRVLRLPAYPRPLVGLSADVPFPIVSFLQEQGYILDTGETALQCSVYLDAVTLERLRSQAKIIEWIESTNGPLVRFWRWPSGAKSALALTGDLDALSLMDYASRLWVK